MAVAAIVWRRLQGHKRAGPCMLTRKGEVQSGMLFRARRDPYYLHHPTGRPSEVLRLAVKAGEDIHKDAATVISAQHNHEAKVHATIHLGMKDLVRVRLARMVAEAVLGVQDHPDRMEAEGDRRDVAPRPAGVPVADVPRDHRVVDLGPTWDTAKRNSDSN